MKVFKKSALVLAMTASAGMAHASAIDIRADVQAGIPAIDTAAADTAGTVEGPVTVDALWTSQDSVAVDIDGTLPGGLVGARSVVYFSDVALVDGSTLRFETANGALEGSTNLALFAYDTVGGAYVKVASLNDFAADADGNYTSASFQFDTDGLAGTEAFQKSDATASAVVAAGDPLPAGTILVVANDANADDAFDAGENASFVANEGLTAGQSVSISLVEARDDASNELTAPRAGSENVLTVIDGVSLALTQETSIIDVESTPSRSRFVEENNPVGAAPDTSETVSRAAVTLQNTAEFGLTLDAGDEYELTLTRSDVSGVDDVEVGGNAATFVEDDSAYIYADAFDGLNLAGGANVDILVGQDAENNALQTGNWTVSLTVNPDQDANEPADLGELNVSVDSDGVSHIWGINGAQVKIPYHAQNVPGFIFFTKIVNESDRDAEVFADVIVEQDPNGGSPNNVTVENVSLGVVPAEGSLTIGQAAIQTAINGEEAGTIAEGQQAHLAMTLTVLAPIDEVQVSAYQKDAVGRTDLPVYFNTGAGRNWLQ